MKPGDLYVFMPLKYEYNPEKDSPPIIGLYLETIRSNMKISQFKVLGPNGIQKLYVNRWVVEERL